jgi:hypothetical protein
VSVGPVATVGLGISPGDINDRVESPHTRYP